MTLLRKLWKWVQEAYSCPWNSTRHRNFQHTVLCAPCTVDCIHYRKSGSRWRRVLAVQYWPVGWLLLVWGTQSRGCVSDGIFQPLGLLEMSWRGRGIQSRMQGHSVVLQNWNRATAMQWWTRGASYWRWGRSQRQCSLAPQPQLAPFEPSWVFKCTFLHECERDSDCHELFKVVVHQPPTSLISSCTCKKMSSHLLKTEQ